MRAEDRCEMEALCTYNKLKNIERFTQARCRGQKLRQNARVVRATHLSNRPIASGCWVPSGR